jgi:hypothetical protein
MISCQKLFSARNRSVGFTAEVDAQVRIPRATKVF